jgi:hypothetical protein
MKRKKRYADGGTVDDEIIVEGMRPQSFNLASLARGPASGSMGPSMPGDGGGATLASMAPSRAADRRAPPIARTAGYLGPTFGGDEGRVSLGVGRRGAIGAGASIPFKKGGAVKTKKMAKGGSTASKRADGCATKGKTKGRFV